MKKKCRAGVVGATGYVGQRFVSLLADHPWFELSKLGASPRSAGRSYGEAVSGRWKIDTQMPAAAADMTVLSVEDAEAFAEGLDVVFCAVDMPKAEIMALEERLAKAEVAVISNNSANRLMDDVPMIIPEINGDHARLIDWQRRRLGTRRGFIACKPNCSIQSYVPALEPLRKFGLEKVLVSTYQAISGAGKTFGDWPEMEGNLIPFIGGEEEKSEVEPLKIWGHIEDGRIVKAEGPVISAQCYRVAVQEGHTASVAVSFSEKPTAGEIRAAWNNYISEPQRLELPSAPKQFLLYMEDNDRPQPLLDAGRENGMGITIGRLREDTILDYKFTCLSHNTLRGAAGGGVLMAELLVNQGYITNEET